MGKLVFITLSLVISPAWAYNFPSDCVEPKIVGTERLENCKIDTDTNSDQYVIYDAISNMYWTHVFMGKSSDIKEAGVYDKEYSTYCTHLSSDWLKMIPVKCLGPVS